MKELKESILGGDLAERLADFDKMVNLNDIKIWSSSFKEITDIEFFVYSNVGHIWFKKATEFMEQFAESMKRIGVDDLRASSFRNGLQPDSEIFALARAYDNIAGANIKHKGPVTLDAVYYKVIDTMNSLCENKVIRGIFEFCNKRWKPGWDFPIYIKLLSNGKLRIEVFSGRNGVTDEQAEAFAAAVQDVISNKKLKYVKDVEVYDNRANSNDTIIYITFK